jgi:Ca-activated chloride channel family protein
VSYVNFLVDGVVVCHITSSPFKCIFDAGTSGASKMVAAYAMLANGHAITRVVQTAADLRPVFRSTVNVVYVPAVVKDRAGKAVKELAQDSFEIYEDGVKRPVAYFQAENPKVDLAVALDVSTSMSKALPTARDAVSAFVGWFRASDQVTLLAFNDRVYVLARADASAEDRRRLIGQLRASGGTALYDAVLMGVDVLGNEIASRALVMLTDGRDWNSLAPLTAVESRLRSSDVSLYMVVCGADDESQAVRTAVGGLVDSSGGSLFSVREPGQIRAVFQQIADDLTRQYLLGFEPSPDGAGKAHRIQVKVVGHPEYTVRARTVFSDSH